MSYIDVKEVNLLDENGQLINPAEDESVVLLRRLLFIAQSLGSRDANGTLRVNIAGQDITPNINNINSIAGLPYVQQVTDIARTAYNTGIRSNIIIS